MAVAKMQAEIEAQWGALEMARTVATARERPSSGVGGVLSFESLAQSLTEVPVPEGAELSEKLSKQRSKEVVLGTSEDFREPRAAVAVPAVQAASDSRSEMHVAAVDVHFSLEEML